MTDWAKMLTQADENSAECVALRNEIGNLRYEIEKLSKENDALTEEIRRLKSKEQQRASKINERIRHRTTQFF